MAEGEGFEPSVVMDHDRLATCCFKPLSHPSVAFRVRFELTVLFRTSVFKTDAINQALPPEQWSERLDLNQRLLVPKTSTLPLSYSPMGVGKGFAPLISCV